MDRFGTWFVRSPFTPLSGSILSRDEYQGFMVVTESG
jgi:hypothetical protein